MKKLFDAVKNILGFNNNDGNMPWVYIAGEGRWERKKPARPLVRVALFTGALLLIAGAGFSFVSQNNISHNDIVLLEVREPSFNPADINNEAEEVNESNNEANESEIKVVEVEAEEINEVKAEDANLNNLEPQPVKKANANNNLNVNNKNYKDLKDYWIKINKGSYTLALYKGDELVKEYNVAVGKNPGDKQRKGDHRTPVGDFRIVSIEDASNWKHDFGDGKGKIAGAYGPWFLRLDAGGWKGIGIHGTHDPDSLGTMASEGCIRMENSEIQELKNFAYRKMRVLIQE